MTQNGVVTRVLNSAEAEISVVRGTACGGSCGSCESCVYDTKIRVTAENSVGAVPGDRVIIEGETEQLLGAAAYLYLLPLAGFFAAYFVPMLWGGTQTACIIASFCGAALTFCLLARLQKKRKQLRFRIVGYQK